MKRDAKKNRLMIAVFTVLYAVYAVCLFWYHPFIASAKEPVPGGKGNTVVMKNRDASDGINDQNFDITMQAKDNYEIVAVLSPVFPGSVNGQWSQRVSIRVADSSCSSINKDNLADYVGVLTNYYLSNGMLQGTKAYTMDNIKNSFNYANSEGNVSFEISGCKVFDSMDSLRAYVATGSLDGMIKEPELDKSWYLKDVSYKVDADDSPTSEAGEDATYITFTWSTDNLQEGDLLEIKTHNVLKKIGGDQISGFHDYITRNNNVSAFDGSYRFSQYEATKAWFSTLENKPLMFKSYDTDIYYLRPYRNGKYGGWVRISMKRATPTSSPYIEDIEYGDFDDDGEWITDEKLTEDNGGHHGINQGGDVFYPNIDNPFEGTNIAGIFEYFFKFMKSIPSLLGDLPALVGSICSFLPSWVIGFIALGVVVAIILRVVGR